jgi:hypothetical protein
MCQTHGSLNEIAKGAKDSNGFTKCWPGKHAEGTKKGKNGGQVRNCVPNESLDADQKRVGQVSGKERANSIGQVIAKPPKQHPFKGRLVGEELDHKR